MSTILDQYTGGTIHRNLGTPTCRDLRSTVGTCSVFPMHVISYPPVVIAALGNLYREYNAAFAPLVDHNREWPEDYRLAMVEGMPVNCGVQIDMVGLPEQFLADVSSMPEHVVREILRKRIFEIENSLAMYQLLEQLHPREGRDSYFKVRFRGLLASLRKRIGMPIALLAVTHEKYDSMKQNEFGYINGLPVPDAEVAELSGFDAFFGPDQFREHLARNGGKCGYALYVRSSDPVAKLKDPRVVVDHPLLADHEMRRIIKAHSVTFNVDDPLWQPGDWRRINDTKGYMAPMGMGYQINSPSDILSVDLAAHLLAGRRYEDFRGERRLSQGFTNYLETQGINPDDVATGRVSLRAKPLQCTFGCYGHVAGALTSGDFRSELRRNMKQRGGYVIQPEMQVPRVHNLDDDVTYAYIDRNFMGCVRGRPVFLSGVRMLMPSDSTEAKRGRIHGNSRAVMAEIYGNA